MISEQKNQVRMLIEHGSAALRCWEGEKAQECFQHAISLLPPFMESALNLKEYRYFQLELVPAYYGLAKAFQQMGKPSEAINYLLHAFKIAPQDRNLQQAFASVVTCMEVEEYHEALAEAVITLLYSPQVNPQDLSLLGWSLWQCAPLKNDLLLYALLNRTIVPKRDFEQFFITTRRGFLSRALNGENLQKERALLEALSVQARLTESIYAVTEKEKRELSKLKDLPDSPEKGLLLAAYEPAPAALPSDTVQAFGKILDKVSQAVEKQYEENPYPQWIQIAAVESKPLPQVMRELFPFRTWEELPEKPSVLIAGCGTGSHAAKTAHRLQHSDFLAIDLSRSSLAYAEKKMWEQGVQGVKFLQMDLLDLETYGKTFDVIEAVGVLHHMEKPNEGLKALKKCLNPNGVMNLGLYSKLARQDVWAARKVLNWQGEPVTADVIKAARQRLYELPEGELAKEVTKSLDFFSVSGVRDLLYNVQEHTFTLPEIGHLLAEVGLEWIGFEWWHPQWTRRYRKAYPEDSRMQSLMLWDLFEQENPQTFLAMYNFWVRKP